MRLSGKRILITAAGQGMGRASAIACAAEGAEVIATDRDPALLVGLDGVETAALDVTGVATHQQRAGTCPPHERHDVVGSSQTVDIGISCAVRPGLILKTFHP